MSTLNYLKTWLEDENIPGQQPNMEEIYLTPQYQYELKKSIKCISYDDLCEWDQELVLYALRLAAEFIGRDMTLKIIPTAEQWDSVRAINRFAQYVVDSREPEDCEAWTEQLSTIPLSFNIHENIPDYLTYGSWNSSAIHLSGIPVCRVESGQRNFTRTVEVARVNRQGQIGRNRRLTRRFSPFLWTRRLLKFLPISR